MQGLNPKVLFQGRAVVTHAFASRTLEAEADRSES